MNSIPFFVDVQISKYFLWLYIVITLERNLIWQIKIPEWTMVRTVLHGCHNHQGLKLIHQSIKPGLCLCGQRLVSVGSWAAVVQLCSEKRRISTDFIGVHSPPFSNYQHFTHSLERFSDSMLSWQQLVMLPQATHCTPFMCNRDGYFIM